MTGAELAAVAQTLRVDSMTADVVGALRAAGVEPILLKGPVLARFLRLEGRRPYGDCDLLVAPADRARAERALASAGFAPVPRDWERADRIEHDSPWHRADAGTVDLHRTLPAARGVSPEQLWRRLASHRVAFALPGTRLTVTALDDAGLALLTGLHAAHHREHPAARRRPLADLERAVAVVGAATWEAAAALARELRAAGQLTRGLHMVAGGAALATRLHLPPPASTADDWDHSALRALWPAPSYLRWSLPGARGGRLALARAYAARPLVLLRALRDG